jgi:colicin import membrane protein
MARKLKTYQTSIGFFDLAIAAPSMKAALEIWGADSNLFHQGFARETEDPAVVAATIEHPGIVLRRPVGTDGAFKETADLPTGLGSGKSSPTSRPQKAKPPSGNSSLAGRSKAREAAAAFEKEQRTREAAQRRQEQARAKERERRDMRVAKAQKVLDAAEKEHDARNAAMQAERDAIEERLKSEDERWEQQRGKLGAALRQAKAGN